MSLLQSVRKFWYNNEPGTFEVDGQKITRQQIQVYGGPNPEFNDCPICQRCEWLSRVLQRNLFKPHGCPTAGKCHELCGRQGDELWTHYHQNFFFSLGCDSALNAPKCLLFFPKKLKSRMGQRFWQNVCDPWALVLKRQLAQVCQVDVVDTLDGVEWDKYDFMYYQNAQGLPVFDRPPIPQVAYGHDVWKGDLQAALTWLKPEVLLTHMTDIWKARYDIPKETKVMFYLPTTSTFFQRSNLGAKRLAILCVGALYPMRQMLHEQIEPLAKAFKVEWHYEPGYYRNNWTGPVKLDTEKGGKVRYLNAWSEYLGSSIYTMFGPQFPNMLKAKHFELLASGAIPIMPHHPLLDELGVHPMEHYIPLIRIWKHPRYVKRLLKRRDDYRYIAENSVRWHRENVDWMLFDGFEDVVQHVTGGKYPRRLVGG